MSAKFIIVLASSSIYRAQQLINLKLNFIQLHPDTDENQYKIKIKNPIKLALKLSECKANSVVNIIRTSEDYQGEGTYLIIGSDQVVSIENKILDKPHTIDNAVRQLEMLSGKEHSLITALTVLKFKEKTIETKQCFVTQKMQMFSLGKEAIQNYVQLDKPVNCAGSYMIEGAGISLFDKIEGDDWTSITGLPMLKLVKFLREFGYVFDYS